MLYPYPGYCGTGRTELTEVPGTGMNVLQNSEISGTGMKIIENFQKFQVLWHGRTELTGVFRAGTETVSYTHLTLPTILLV